MQSQLFEYIFKSHFEGFFLSSMDMGSPAIFPWDD